MRPYLAIVRDSFHEALASRVLWILVLLIAVLLLLLTPVGIHEQAGWQFTAEDILDPAGLARKLSAAGRSDKDSVARRVWRQLDADRRRQLASPPATDRNRPFEAVQFQAELAAMLNGLLDSPELFDRPEAMGFVLGREGKELYEQGLHHLPADKLARYNRLVLDRVFAGEIVAVGPTQLSITYAFWTPFSGLPATRDEFAAAVSQSLMVFMVFVLGVAGIMVAIVVTATIVPQTFEGGAIDLLLSKPVARPLVYLTKFCGGCAFIFLNSGLLIGGLWLVLGARLGIWNHRMLLCIPLYVFLFAIYYSVSSLSGVVWRNAIVSVMMTVLFWGACFTLGTAKSVIESYVMQPRRLVKLVPAGRDLLAVNQRGQVQRWNSTQGGWEEVFAGDANAGPPLLLRFGIQMLGPVYDPRSGRLLAGDLSMRQFMPGAASSPLLVGREATHWRRTATLPLPPGAEAMFLDRDGTLLVVTPRGVSRLEGNPEERPQPMKLFGFELPIDAKDRRFVEAGPVLGLRAAFSASFDPQAGALAVYDGRRLLVLEEEPPARFRLRKEELLDPGRAGVVALGGARLLLACADGEVQIRDPATLALQHTFPRVSSAPPRFALAADGGRRFFVLFHDGRLWHYDAAAGRGSFPPVEGQYDISAVATTPEGRLLIADRLSRVIEYRLDDWTPLARRDPGSSLAELAFRRGLLPVYTVFPKPAELDNMVLYLLTGKTSVAASNRPDDLGAMHVHVDVWGPVRSNLIFLAVMLGIGCVYVTRKDF